MKTIKAHRRFVPVAVLAMSAMVAASAPAFPATTCVKSGKETVTYTVNGKTKSKSVYTSGFLHRQGMHGGSTTRNIPGEP